MLGVKGFAGQTVRIRRNSWGWWQEDWLGGTDTLFSFDRRGKV